MSNRKEVWLRGIKTEGLSPFLQPVADALYEAQEEINLSLESFPDELLWEVPAGIASVGFHIKHIIGFQDRLLTYAEGNALNQEQFEYLKNESVKDITDKKLLLFRLHSSIDKTIERLKNFPDDILTQPREVGRAGLPSTVIGLCVHAAEHTMRHTGQLLVTSRILLS